jgi:hypothetical protein
MDFATSYEICSPGVIAEEFDGDIVILNLEDGRYFSLRGAGPIVWNALMAGATAQTIIDSANPARNDRVDAIIQFLCRLHELQLIRTASEVTNISVATPIDWNSLSAGDRPEIEVFDDLAELILADPIHDVDAEVGWPMRKTA